MTGSFNDPERRVSVCRMIMAQGVFCAVDVMEAARAMCCGETAKHDGAVREHHDGWGCLWKANDQIFTLRGEGSFADELSSINIPLGIDFLAIHVRHSTLKKNVGVKFSHPVKHQVDGQDWYMMHNGYLPTIYLNLGLGHSSFDSAEYLEYIVAGGSVKEIDLGYLENKMSAVKSGGSARNCFLITHDKAWAWQWYAEVTRSPVYFTLNFYKDERVSYVSSEIIPFLGAESCWRAMKNNELIEICLKNGGGDELQ